MLFDDPTIWNWFTEGSYHQKKPMIQGYVREDPHIIIAHNMVQYLYFKGSEFPTVFELVVILFVGEYRMFAGWYQHYVVVLVDFVWWEFQLLSSTVVMPTTSKAFSTRVENMRATKELAISQHKACGFATLFFWSQKWLNHAKAI